MIVVGSSIAPRSRGSSDLDLRRCAAAVATRWLAGPAPAAGAAPTPGHSAPPSSFSRRRVRPPAPSRRSAGTGCLERPPEGAALEREWSSRRRPGRGRHPCRPAGRFRRSSSAPSGVRTIRTRSRLCRAVRQATHDRVGIRATAHPAAGSRATSRTSSAARLPGPGLLRRAAATGFGGVGSARRRSTRPSAGFASPSARRGAAFAASRPWRRPSRPSASARRASARRSPLSQRPSSARGLAVARRRRRRGSAAAFVAPRPRPAPRRAPPPARPSTRPRDGRLGRRGRRRSASAASSLGGLRLGDRDVAADVDPPAGQAARRGGRSGPRGRSPARASARGRSRSRSGAPRRCRR